MSGWSNLSTGSKTLAGVVAALLLGVGIYLFYQQLNGKTVVSGEPILPASETVETAALPAVQAPDVGDGESAVAVLTLESEKPAEPVSDVAEPVVAEPDAPVTPPENAEPVMADEATAPQPEAPVFDVVRVDPQGNVLVAGRAEPNSEVTVTMDGETIDTTRADASGAFVSLFAVGEADVSRSIGLGSVGADQKTVASAQTVLISPVVLPEPVDVAGDEVTTDEAVDDAGTQDVAQATQSAGENSGETASVSDTEIAEPSELQAAGTEETAVAEVEQPEVAVAPQVLLATDEGISVLQPGGASPEVLQAIALDSITYNPAGDVALAGRGSGSGFVRVYLDNKPIKTLPIDPDGRWRAPLPEVDTGVYTLRIDEINDAGTVVSRIETPFKREEPAVLAELNSGQAPENGITLTQVTVQPGNTLWGIASKNFGDGMLFVRVFEANKERISNPDLIYPGQVFAIPN